MHLSQWEKAKADLMVARDKGLDIVGLFHNVWESVRNFEKKNGITVPANIKEMLTRR